MSAIARARDWARRITRDVAALHIAVRDPRTPWPAKAVALAVVAYALSPIDLIPDFIPVLGYLDEVLVLPLGVLFAVRLIPAALMADFREAAGQRQHLPRQWAGAAIVVALWLLAGTLAGWWIWHRLAG